MTKNHVFNIFSRPTCQSFATHFWVATHSLGNAALDDTFANSRLYFVCEELCTSSI